MTGQYAQFKQKHMLTAATLSACLLSAVLDVAPVQAGSLEAKYAISMIGLPIGTADLNGSFEGDRYKLDIRANTTGLMGAFTGGKGAGTATGSLPNQKHAPATFAITAANSSEKRTVRIAMERGAVVKTDITPPLDEKPDRVQVTEVHKRGIIDPVSAFLMPLTNTNGTGESACNRTLPIFDGAARYDIRLSYAGTKTIKIDGYQGEVFVCNARYVPIAGHRALRKATTFMAENRDISAWLAPVSGTKLMAPVRVSVKTMIGTAVIEATRFVAAPGVTASTR
ncbi:MAG: DUF3108 domain-containing protein [Bosea sp. (in: a-proteobacteria)]